MIKVDHIVQIKNDPLDIDYEVVALGENNQVLITPMVSVKGYPLLWIDTMMLISLRDKYGFQRN